MDVLEKPIMWIRNAYLISPCEELEGMLCPQVLHKFLDGVGLLVQGGESSVSFAEDLALILAIARRFWEYALRGLSRLEKVTVLDGV